MAVQDPLVGSIIGNYKIVEPLGRGAMGVVYRAQDMMLPRLVALKAMPPHLAQDPRLLERFKEGARSAARLNHPNIVTVYGLGMANNTYYMAMEFVDGASLAALIKERGRLPIRRALDITRQMASALDEAHGKGVVHRDVNPHNIMLDRAGNAKLADFGLARVLFAASNLTAPNKTVGTPTYMAPEQWETSKVDGRADIYSLGASLFEMLAGRPPFQEKTAVALMRRVTAEPAPPLTEFAPDIPPRVAQAVARMLEKSPLMRFRTAGEVRAEMEACAAELPAAS